MPAPVHTGMLPAIPRLLNPLAAGLPPGGQPPNLLVRLQKLRAGNQQESSLLSKRAVARTVPAIATVQGYVGVPVASGASS